ncbi:MAG: YraN family protein [Rhodanobacter sp.]|nr:MAG: YraN family protein [Rhodanobacter sp.]TAM15040.1 MAG: YraN family protein [Rhodanobacter sp.]TAM36490.1 MAG: YraN family protein [Rhodanobacter sp.]
MRERGARFEQRAATELERAGLKTLARNYTTRHGELDLVMLDGATVVFVEVRQRAHAEHGDALASITRSKRDKLIRTAQLWLAANPPHAHRTCRFDVVTFDGSADAARGHWLRAAFEAD